MYVVMCIMSDKIAIFFISTYRDVIGYVDIEKNLPSDNLEQVYIHVRIHSSLEYNVITSSSLFFAKHKLLISVYIIYIY